MPELTTEFETELLAAVERYDMMAPGDRVLVALSGGQDSLSLLHCLSRLRADLSVELAAAHLHHGMRGQEADADVEFLGQFCQALGAPFFVKRVSVPGLAQDEGISIEEAGRMARYEFLRETAQAEGCARIALGHTATDRAETVLMNILRGAGLDGLQGIRPVNGEIIRPLIGLWREQTAHYCAAHGLEPRLDRTNLDTDNFLRNRIRLKLMPLLRDEYGIATQRALLRLAQAAEAELDWTDPLIQNAVNNVISQDAEELKVDLGALAAMPDGMMSRVLREGLRMAAGSLTGFTMGHIDDLVALVRGGATGSRLDLPFEVYAKRGYNHLVIGLSQYEPVEPGGWQTALSIPGHAQLPLGGTITAALQRPPDDLRSTARDEAYLSALVAGETLVVRSWREGDRLLPLGMVGSKKLQDLFVDCRVPRLERGRVPVVLNSAGDVLWVAGLCVSRLAALDEVAETCVHLVWESGQALNGSNDN